MRLALKFTADQIFTLRREYAGVKSVDPSQPTYRKLCAKLDDMSDARLQQLALANIKWISPLAINRCIRRGVAL